MLALSIAYSTSAPADLLDVIATNGVEVNQNGSYTVTGTDPFFVFLLDTTKLINKQRSQGNTVIFNDVTLKNSNDDTLENVPMELFFKAVNGANNRRFDPLYRFKFAIPANHKGQLAILIPEGVELQSEQPIRMDIDACYGCRITFGASPKLVSGLSKNIIANTRITADQIFNGGKTIPNSGLTLNTHNWRLNHLQRTDQPSQPDLTRLTITGDDPYLVSGPLNIKTASLGGVLFSLTNHPAATATQALVHTPNKKFQVFYATDKHAFIEDASSVVHINDDDQGRSRFVLPLQFLSEQQPSALLLKRLRLDIVADKNTGEWAFDEVILLNKTQIQEHAELIPTKMIQTKRQRAYGLGLLVNIAKKILSDLGFTIAYLIMLIVTAIGFYRQFKR